MCDVCGVCVYICVCTMYVLYMWFVMCVCSMSGVYMWYMCVCYMRFGGVGLRYALRVAALGVVIRTRKSEQPAVSRPDM